MGILAAACGVLFVVFGLVTTRRSPTDAQFGAEITCLVGGLVLIFLGVTLGRIAAVSRRLDERARDADRAGGGPDREPV